MSITVFSPISVTEPDIDCPACDGEGVDLDPRGMFDFDIRGACPMCWKWTPDNSQDFRDE